MKYGYRWAPIACVLFARLMPGTIAQAQTSLEPEGWDRGVRLTDTQDANPDPHVVEVTLDARVAPIEIAPGERLDAWTYNGSVPGPFIRAKVGDRVIVHVTNH